MTNFLARIGNRTRQNASRVLRVVAMMAAVVWIAVQPRYWPRTVRDVLARQILFTGVESIRFISVAGILVGISVVLQAQVWLVKFGQSQMLGTLLVAVVVRELGPLLTCLIVIGRSGTAIASELASMQATRQIDLLETQGLDPFTYLVLPRVVGVAVSVLCLTIIFTVVCLLSGFVTGALFAAGGTGPLSFARGVAQALQPMDLFVLFAKTLIPGLLMGAICCDAGMSVERDLADIPRATTRGQVYSLMAVFVTFVMVSLLVYL
jgi:phospholipid/cholesterol/gamma-HCH transport system permease protein